MKSKIRLLAVALALAWGLVLLPSVATVRAQNNTGGAQTTGAASSQSSRTTTTTTQTAQPAQSTTTVTKNTTGVDPLWLVIGGIGILAILLIVILSMRGRSRTNVTTVERETVIKK